MTIYIGVGVGAVVLIGAIAILSGGQTPRRKRKHKPVQQVATTSTIDWYSKGYSRGSAWKAATQGRKMHATPDEVQFIAERMTSDYTNKGIDAVGEQRFIKGFKEAALGK
jgi:hypothetical protein